jgi:type I restriction enzyme S subunit
MRSGILERRFPVAFVPFETTLNQDMRAVIPHEGIDARWIAWGLRAFEREILRDCRKAGTTVASIEAPRLMDFVLPLPPIEEQRRIVDILEDHLSRLDAAIAYLHEASARAVELCRSVLLDASLGHAERQSETSLRDVRWDSEDPPRVRLPPSWVWRKWREVGASQNGRAFPSNRYVGEGIRLLRPGNLGPNGTLVWDPKATRHLPKEFADANQDLLLHVGDIVMNLTAQSLKDDFLGRACLVRQTDEALLNQRLARLTSEVLVPEFAVLLFRSPMFRAYVTSLNKGSLIQHMFTKQIAEFWVPVPPRGAQLQAVVHASHLLHAEDRLVASVAREASRIEGLRLALLQAAFAGRLIGKESDLSLARKTIGT